MSVIRVTNSGRRPYLEAVWPKIDKKMPPGRDSPCARRQLVSGLSYASLKPDRASGSVRIRFPVAAKTAFATAGSTGGSAGSPSPVGS